MRCEPQKPESVVSGAASHLALKIADLTAAPVISLCGDSSLVGAGIPWMLRNVPGTRVERPARDAFPIAGEQYGVSGNLKFDRNGNRLVPLELLEFWEGRFAPLAGETNAALPP